jgi:TPR repeat protein
LVKPDIDAFDPRILLGGDMGTLSTTLARLALCFSLAWVTPLHSAPSATPATLKSACDRGDANACFELAELYDEGKGVPKSVARSLLLYERSCTLGYSWGCQYLATHYDRVTAGPEDLTRAVNFYKQGCDRKNGNSCFRLGLMYDAGRGVPRDDALASKYLDLGCALGSQMCSDAESLAASAPKLQKSPAPAAQPARPTSTPAKPAQAATAKQAETPASLQIACRRNDYASCAQLGLAYDSGKGVPKNKAVAADHYRLACNGNDRLGCLLLGMALQQGDGVPRDYAAAARAYTKSCDAGSGGACDNLSRLYYNGLGVTKSIARSNQLMARSCELAHAEACTVIGARYSSGKDLAKNIPEAVRYFHRACDLNDLKACSILAGLYASGEIGGSNFAQTNALALKACNGDIGTSCFILGLYQLNGAGGQRKDFAKAAGLFDKACRLKNANGCSYLGKAYAAGEGVGRDPAKAASYARMACELDKTQCQQLASTAAASPTSPPVAQSRSGRTPQPVLPPLQANPPTGQLTLVRISAPTAPVVYFFERNSIKSISTPSRNAALIWGLSVHRAADSRLGVPASAYWQLLEIDCLEYTVMVRQDAAVDSAGKVLRAAAGTGSSKIEYRTTMAAYASVACRLGNISGEPLNSVAAAVSQVTIDCQAVTIKPAALNKGDTHVTFNASPAIAALSYNWTVSAGTILSGQGTSSILVDASIPAGESITTSVELGTHPSCRNRVASATVTMP